MSDPPYYALVVGIASGGIGWPGVSGSSRDAVNYLLSVNDFRLWARSCTRKDHRGGGGAGGDVAVMSLWRLDRRTERCRHPHTGTSQVRCRQQAG